MAEHNSNDNRHTGRGRGDGRPSSARSHSGRPSRGGRPESGERPKATYDRKTGGFSNDEDRPGRDARRSRSNGGHSERRDDRNRTPGRGYGDRDHDRRRGGYGQSSGHGSPDGSGESFSSGGSRGTASRRPAGGERRNRDDARRGGGRNNNGGRGHAQRAGAGRRGEDDFRAGPQRSGFREERIKARMVEPDLPDDITAQDLDPSVRQDLRSLSKDNAEAVGRHMVMSATLMADDPELALRHARAAKDRAGRVAVVRETCGIAAYHAGEWKEALAELRAARRMSGGPGLLAVMADCERGLGRPERAVEMSRTEDIEALDPDSRTEFAIVLAGARKDMGDVDAAVIELQREDLNPARTGASAARLFYAYADALAAAGRTEEAREWFSNAKNADTDEMLDTDERLAELN
ncbi:hypothetical protein [Corynebacterium pygosceleis]|uniref:hypothetical protein n=1 Tax=Corynebacterium pygosceleis TaxID=2800406 RepID=UPI0019084E8A|nr:hypothetical protein [Corynebacterium pygosceleis]MCK7674614.1 hypothetical protein [Corynebacterium pygosceleis]MCL0120084.1 hypothetical protein [Corynebacterium pygosceleis]